MINGDIKLENYDLLIDNGDFVIIDSDQQNVDLILNTSIGNWFENPLVGVGIINYLASPENPLVLEALIKKQLTNDGFKVESISIKGTTIETIDIQILAHR